MSFLAAKQNTPKQQEPHRQPYRLSGAMPVVFGVGRVSMVLLDNEWNRVENDEGKTRQNSHWMSVAGAFCHGPVVSIQQILVAGGLATNVPVVFGGDDVVAVSIGYGDYGIHFRAYKGTDDQDEDPRLIGIAGDRIEPADGSSAVFMNRPAPNTHPNYARICYAVFDVIAAGWGVGSAWEGGANIPEIEADIYRLPSIVIGNESAHFGVNPVAIIYDLLTDPIYGLGLPDSIVPLSEWTALAQRYSDEIGPQEYLHVTLSERAEIQKHLAEILEYINGFPRVENGKFLIDWFPLAGPVDSSALPQITTHDLVKDVLDVEGNDWKDTVSSVSVTFLDAGQNLGEETITVNSPYNVQMTGEPKTEKFERPFIHDYWQATRAAQRKLARLCSPDISGQLTVFRERAVRLDGSPLNRGDLFHFDYADHQLDLVCRVVERTERGRDVLLKWINEPGQWPEVYIPTRDIRSLPFAEPPGALEYIELFEVPPPLRGASMWPPRVMPLIQRPNSSTTSAKVWISATGDFAGEEQELADLTQFANRATVIGAVNDEDTSLTLGTDAGLLSRSFTAAEIANGHVLAYVPSTGEVMVLGALLDADEGERIYQVQRGQFWTAAQDIADAGVVWVFQRSALDDAYQHALITAGTIYFRFQSASLFEEGEVTDNISITLTHQEPMIALDPAPDTDTFFKEASELVYVHRGMDFPLNVEVEGWIRKVWVSLHYNQGDDENPPEGVEDAWQKRTVAYFEYNGNWRDEEILDLNIPLDMDVGWNAIMVSVEDIRGPEYITNALGWLWIWDIPAPAFTATNTSRTGLEIELTPVTGAQRYEIEVERSIGLFPFKRTKQIYTLNAPDFMLELDNLIPRHNYRIRTRSASLDGRFGPWSGYTTKTISPPAAPLSLADVGATIEVMLPEDDEAVALWVWTTDTYDPTYPDTNPPDLTVTTFGKAYGIPNRQADFNYYVPSTTIYFFAAIIDKDGYRSDYLEEDVTFP